MAIIIPPLFTVYRRIKSLQEEGYLKEKMLGIPDLEKMVFTFIIVGMNVEIDSMDRAVSLMREMDRIKTIWETYGQHNIVIVMLCEKENVGDCINEIKKYLTEKNIEINSFDVSTAVESHKLDLSPPFSEVYDFSE